MGFVKARAHAASRYVAWLFHLCVFPFLAWPWSTWQPIRSAARLIRGLVHLRSQHQHLLMGALPLQKVFNFFFVSESADLRLPCRGQWASPL